MHCACILYVRVFYYSVSLFFSSSFVLLLLRSSVVSYHSIFRLVQIIIEGSKLLKQFVFSLAKQYKLRYHFSVYVYWTWISKSVSKCYCASEQNEMIPEYLIRIHTLTHKLTIYVIILINSVFVSFNLQKSTECNLSITHWAEQRTRRKRITTRID